jgi:putative ATP-grasp target RiPP
MEIYRPSSLTIEDLPVAGTELSEDELANVAGGMWCVCVKSACSSASGGGYDYD